MTIFLDFDAVVHPFCAREAGVPVFAYLPSIESMLAGFSATRVIVCNDGFGDSEETLLREALP